MTDADDASAKQLGPAYLAAAQATDDAAYIALHDVTGVLAGHEEAAVVGGHMVGILCALYPSPGLVIRRTGDADAGIPVQVARTGDIHASLIAAGYAATQSNRYEKETPEGLPNAVIDILVSDTTGATRIREVEIAGRRFDSVPGLYSAIVGAKRIDVEMLLRDGTTLTATPRVPTVELALVVKALAWADRGADKDVTDIANLLAIRDHHGADAGPWTLNAQELSSTRRDGAAALHDLADRWERAAPARTAVDVRRLVVHIRRHVTDPRPRKG